VNCLDAETLAAWFDGGLSGAALEDVRSHVAGCARCQAFVGAMGRTRAAVPAPESDRSPRWWLAWAVPVAAAATAVAIWVAVPRPASVAVNSPPVSTLQKKDAQTPSTPPPATPAEAKPAAAPVASANAAKQAPSTPTNTLSAQAAAPAASTAERREAAERPAAAAETRQLQARDAFALSPCGPMWPSPPSEVAGQITAGSGPSADVCWIVGRAGTVLRSTDHQTWQRVNLPVTVDLSRVNATDAASATVVTTDGRTFSTADGGATWTQR
jgi:putative zinc finger protein